MTKQELRYIIDALESGSELSPEWAQVIWPADRRECNLTYFGKAREEEILADALSVPLQPARTFGENGHWQNKIIFGDNLQVLKSLLDLKLGGDLCNADGTPGVRLVYLDPPFATKQEFRGGRNEKAYQDKIAGAEFIEFLRKRLVLIRELLSHDGSVFLHMDWRKIHYLKVLMDEVFSEHNFRNEIILPGRASKNLQQQFETITRLSVRHDTLLWYSKKRDTRFRPLWMDKHDAGNPEGHWHHFWSTANRKGMRYELFGITPRTGQWTWEENRARRAIANYQRFLKESGERTLAEYWRDTGSKLDFIRPDPDDGKPQYWRAPAERRLADTVWAGVPIYSNTTGYPTEKNEALLTEILQLASRDGDLVLDPFLGSGTAAAVAEKMGRRWIGIDCGKLSVYTVQKRLLSINGGERSTRPFTVYNAGLYDLSRLRSLDWSSWRFFALQLFQCRDERHKIGGVALDGYLKGASVLVFDYKKHSNARIDDETIRSLHEALGSKVGSRFFIIAPATVFDFQQDYIEIDDVRYYALRIPYSIIHELHERDFSALAQPVDAEAVNDTVESVGFDFIRRPQLKFDTGVDGKQRTEEIAFIRLTRFHSDAAFNQFGSDEPRDALSMVLLDFDYVGDAFAIDEVRYGEQIARDGWMIRFPLAHAGKTIAAVFVDVYGNEAMETIPVSRFQQPPVRKRATTVKRAGASRKKQSNKKSNRART